MLKHSIAITTTAHSFAVSSMLGVIPMEFDLIYADPSWLFKTYSDKGQGRAPKYPPMTLEDLAKIEVAEIRKKNCVLFLWVTWPHLHNGMDLMSAWGFSYRTNAWTWVKNRMAKGYYTRKKTEVCLIGARGSVPVAVKDEDDLIFADVRAHIQKPDDAYVKMSRLYPNAQYPDRLELFASEYSMHTARNYGFIPVGFDVDGKDIRDAVRDLK